MTDWWAKANHEGQPSDPRIHAVMAAAQNDVYTVSYTHLDVYKRQVKYTRNNQAMAFLTVEDLTGSVEIIVFPKDYERYNRFLNDEEKIFVVGHATVEEEQDGKVICERIVPFDDTRKELWLQFPTKSDFSEKERCV